MCHFIFVHMTMARDRDDDDDGSSPKRCFQKCTNETERTNAFDRFAVHFYSCNESSFNTGENRKKIVRTEMQFKLFKHCILCVVNKRPRPKSFRFHLVFFSLSLLLTDDCSRCWKIISVLSIQYVSALYTHTQSLSSSSSSWSSGSFS